MAKTDVIVVLGGGIQKDGSLPNLVKLRLNKAFKLWKTNPDSPVITSGKWSIAAEEPPVISEAEGMRRYLIERGIPEEKILKEDRSQDTVANAYFLKTEFLIPNGWKSLRVVTSTYHLERAKYIFKKVLGQGYNIKFFSTPSELDRESLERVKQRQNEVFALVKKYFAEIKDGDHKKVEKILKEGSYYNALKQSRTPFIKEFVSKGKVRNKQR